VVAGASVDEQYEKMLLLFLLLRRRQALTCFESPSISFVWCSGHRAVLEKDKIPSPVGIWIDIIF
jgi:hypothetical protein